MGVYTAKFNFDCFFKDVKTARDSRSTFFFNYKNYIETWECKSLTLAPLLPIEGLESPFEDEQSNFPFGGGLFGNNLIFSKPPIISDNDGNEKTLTIYEHNISEESGVIDPNSEHNYGIGELGFTDNGKAIVMGFSIYFSGREKRALFLTISYTDLSALLHYLEYTFQEITIQRATDWYKNQLELLKDYPAKLAVIYEFLPFELFERLKFDNDFFKTEIYRLVPTNNFSAVRNLIALWISFDSRAIYEYFNTDYIVFYIYITFSEDYGDRQEIAEYVALLVLIYQAYKDEREIPLKNFFMPVNEEFLFEVNPISSNGKPKIRIKTFTETWKGGRHIFTQLTPDREYQETKEFRPLETFQYYVKVPKDQLDLDEFTYVETDPDNNVIFRPEVPAVFFMYQYEEEYVKYFNRGRLEFAINAITSIANLGIAKAIVAPTSKLVFRFAVAEFIFESIHRAIINPIVTEQLQESVAGSHFLYVWNNYVAPAGNAVFILHGFAELFIALGKSKSVINAVAKSGDPEAVKNLARLTGGGVELIRNALKLSDDAVKVLRKFNLKIVVNRKNIDLVDSAGRHFMRLHPDDVDKYLVFFSLTKGVRKTKVRDVYRALRSNGKKYNPKNALKRGFDVPKSTAGKIAPDFAGTNYLYNQSSSFRMRLQGSRALDERAAFARMGITDEAQIRLIKKKYVWHHLDDIDEDLQSTFQLIRKDAHRATYSHIGAPKQFEELLGVVKYL